MRAIASLLCAITIAASAVVAIGGFQETLTNEAVVVLIKAGLSPATVIPTTPFESMWRRSAHVSTA